MKLDWNKLSARERDALVIEKAMGFKRLLKMNNIGEREFFVHSDEGVYVLDHGNHIKTCKPTERIQDAWLVVQKMRGKLYSKSHKFVDLLPIIIGARIGLVGLMHPSEVMLHVTPDDICLAACRAEGVGV